MTREEFIKLLEYNGFTKDDRLCNLYNLYCAENNKVISFKLYEFDGVVDCVTLYSNTKIMFDVYGHNSIKNVTEFAKIKGVELKPLPRFRPHWKITANKEYICSIDANELNVFIKSLYLDIIWKNPNTDGKQSNFAYYWDGVLHEAVWVREEDECAKSI